METNNQMEMPNQWEAGPNEVMVIPKKYLDPLQYEVIVFGTREFTIQCVKYYPTDKETWTFDRVMMDTSTHDPEGNLTWQKMSYYPAISLTNAAFMILPNPKSLPKLQEHGREFLFKVVVFGKREFTFRCAEYKQGKDGLWTFEGAVRDTSGPPITVKLVSAAFMVMPTPEAES